MKAFDPSGEDSRKRTKPLYLLAARLITQRPRAEVLAVIPQNIVTLFAQARSRTVHHFAAIEASFVMPHLDGVAMRELFERSLLHRPAP